MIEKRHVGVSDELLRSNPCMSAASLNLRQELANVTVPRLGAEAALEAIADDWGRPACDIMHLVFVTRQ
jgi:chalcone synthase